jgi:hypothetical protein
MTGAVTDADQDGFVRRLRFGQGVGSPSPPMYGVVGVLKEVGAGFLAKEVAIYDGSEL